MPDTSEEKPGFVTVANVEQIALPGGYEQLTGAGVLSLTPPAGADKALIQVEGADVRMKDNGENPTALLGVRLKTTDPPFIYESDLANIKFIEVAASTEINVLYYKNKGNS